MIDPNNSKIWNGDITCAEDLELSQDCEIVTGSIRIKNTTLTTISLPHVIEVHGDVEIQDNNPNLKKISFLKLKTIGGSLTLPASLMPPQPMKQKSNTVFN